VNRYAKSLFVTLFLLILAAGCNRYGCSDPCPKLVTINLIDQNGVSETISNEDRLAQYSNVDFLAPQPFKKVLRVYKRNDQGEIIACITSYYPNGQVQQYLDLVNGRAFGTYRSWHENGSRKIEATVIGGDADLSTGCEKSWIFNGLATAWDINGCMQAQFSYAKGKLQGDSLYYHTNGALWKKLPFKDGVLNGCEEIFLDDGSLMQTTTYLLGEKQGDSQRYWYGGAIAAEECYVSGKLMEGSYYNKCSEKIAEIKCGVGFKAIFCKDTLNELQEYSEGVQRGRVELFDTRGERYKLYHIKDGQKDGEEIDFYPGSIQPKLSIFWSDGKIHGISRTFYPKGTVESQREMAANKKNGILSAWYSDGNLMMIEEYDRDKLVKGEYYKRGDYFPVSTVLDGRGTGSFYDSEGIFMRKVTYRNGRPEL
jgi:antitoxin component YwqK of YwqJK toxin-antitoxin module